jgi:putative transposase
MPIKRPLLITGEFYHIVIRGVDGRNIFSDGRDYHRGILDLYEFNDLKPASWEFRRRQYENSSRTEGVRVKKRLVEILAFCFMPNHIHLLVRQVQDAGISMFMRKFGAGYAGYFNRRHKRKGHLFQGRFRAVHIEDDEQLRVAFVYIHTNPAFLADKGWKGEGISNPKDVIKTIESYKWSSYADYLGKENFPVVIQRDMFNSMMASEEWRKFVNDWVRFKTMDDFGEAALE